MVFGEFYSNYLKCTIVQVNKKNAEKLFNAGKHVFFKANKMRFDNALESPCEIDNMDGRWNTTIGITAFQNACNYFSNSTATTNLDRSNSTAVSNFEAQTALQQANLARSNEKSIDTLDNNLQLTSRNLDNSYNTQTNDIKISFDQQLSDSALGSLTNIIGKAPGQAIMTMLNGILTGGINAATAKAKLDNTINGTGATAPAGERTRAKDTDRKSVV